MADFRRFALGRWAFSASIAILASSALLSIAIASPSFIGLTGVEARHADNSSSQMIEFKSDLPFQYQMQILDKNRVVFRLYNVQVASNLLTPEGSVNMLTGGLVQGASLRTADKRPLTRESYQEIVFQGPGLGEQKIQVVGATELPLAPTIKSPSNPAKVATTKLELLGQKPIPPLRPVKFSTRGASISFPNLSVLEKTVADTPSHTDVVDGKQANAMMALSDGDDSKPDTAMIQPAGFSQRIDIELPQSLQAKNLPAPKVRANQSSTVSGAQAGAQPVQSRTAIATRPLQIESITQVPARGGIPVVHQTVVRSETNQEHEVQMPQSERADSEQTLVDVPAEEAMSQAPETGYQIMKPLPRYQGGAPPIQAITLDTSGNPVMLRPKNEPIQELVVGKPSAGINALFQAETPVLSQGRTVERLMTESLSLYHDKQFGKAEKLINEALQMDPENADLYAALAEVQLQLGQTEPAVQAYRRANQLAPKQYGQPYVQVLVRAGKRQEAIQVLSDLNKLTPRQVQIVYMLGTLHEEQGQISQAMTYLKQAAQLHPASADIQYNLGLAYELAGDHEQAEKHYRQALNLSPSAIDIAKALERVRQ
jgi:Flp pilus assembly protein TadD